MLRNSWNIVSIHDQEQTLEAKSSQVRGIVMFNATSTTWGQSRFADVHTHCHHGIAHITTSIPSSFVNTQSRTMIGKDVNWREILRLTNPWTSTLAGVPRGRSIKIYSVPEWIKRTSPIVYLLGTCYCLGVWWIYYHIGNESWNRH